MFGKTRQIHFVGIGGSGMCGIAEILLSHGFAVTGSDRAAGENTQHLQKLGATVYIGHDALNLGDADVVVVSSAVPDSNPEVSAARRRQVPVIARAEMLAELMKLEYSIAIGGTHGKTTTTAMIATVLECAGLDPTVIDGGRLVHLGSGARAGGGEFLVAEADEAYGSIKRFHPTVAVVTSIDADHLDYYRDIDDIGRVFLEFANRVPFFGVAVLCLDQENVQALIPKLDKRYVTYGVRSDADVTAADLTYDGSMSRCTVRHKGATLGDLTIPAPGEHNILNALAAVCVALELDLEFDAISDALAGFQGVHRRFEVLGEKRGVLVVDDYAHNPAKLKAAFAGARTGFPNRRLVAVFQPHRHHRVKHLADEFSRSFFQTDVLFVTPIYGAGEQPIEGVTGEGLADAIRQHGHCGVTYVHSHDELAEGLTEAVRPGDLVLTVGAGDIWKAGVGLLDSLGGA